MKNHLYRKNICKPILEDISIEQICFLYDFDMLNFRQEKPAFQQVSTALEQVKPAFTSSTGYICEFCKKSFTRKYGLNCHSKICKIKKENDIKKEKDNQELCLMKNEIEILKEKLNKSTTMTTNNTISNNNSNNNTNIINNNIIINNLGEENLKYLKSKDFFQLLQGIFSAIPNLIGNIHFNPEHPENRNIKYPNKKKPYLKVMKNNEWQYVDKKIEVMDLIDSKCYILREKYNSILEKGKYKLSGVQRSRIDSFLSKYDKNDKRVIMDLINRTELILLNNSK